MRKFVLTSALFKGSVMFTYNENGWLIALHNEAEFDEKQHVWLLDHLPKRLEYIEAWSEKIKGKLEELPPDLSFDTFWEAYDKKIHKQRCEPIWKKLNEAKKMLAIVGIKPYDAYLQRTGIAKCLPENYLKKEYYNTDWRREK